jgi:pimeloyl-ACP methyl ester carboxylesterase
MSHTERVLSFGASGSLHGILTEPTPDRRLEGAPGILFWNVGTNHHIGPHRVYVELARRLADLGFSSLRFDLSGLGDSAASRDDNRPDAERNVSDVEEAMLALKKQRGFSRSVLVGFCSSVDAAHAVGRKNPDVAGVIYLEGYQYRTREYYARYPKRLLDRNRWERLLRLRYPKLFGEPASLNDRSLEAERVYVRDYPTQQQFSKDLRLMVERGTKLLFIYSGGDTNYAYRDQLFDFTGAADLAHKIELEFYENADHTFFLVRDRERVMQRVCEWLVAQFGGAGRAKIQAPSTESAAAP